jgi:multiple sugar transport system ATP-binding protein
MDLYLNPKNKFVAGFIGTPAMNFLEGKIIAKNNALFFKRANWEIDLSALNLENLAKHEGEKVSLGIRSEDVYPVDNQGICMPIQVLVLAIELLGSEKLIYAEHDGKQLIAKFPIQEEVKTNTNIDFYYDIEKVYLFDEEEKRIY